MKQSITYLHVTVRTCPAVLSINTHRMCAVNDSLVEKKTLMPSVRWMKKNCEPLVGLLRLPRTKLGSTKENTLRFWFLVYRWGLCEVLRYAVSWPRFSPIQPSMCAAANQKPSKAAHLESDRSSDMLAESQVEKLCERLTRVVLTLTEKQHWHCVDKDNWNHVIVFPLTTSWNKLSANFPPTRKTNQYQVQVYYKWKTKPVKQNDDNDEDVFNFCIYIWRLRDL